MFNCCQFESVVIPRSVTTIANDAFINTGIKHVEFESGSQLIALTGGMFRGCQLESSTNTASVTSIEAGTFVNL
ncbi:MAG: leucine-rich repeat domain-containing protein, partial [Holosporales bacterium]|nr:leucine-rich repeat domain-containing protein [Holosporales bacterium]